jgi:hypothetical protein
MTRFIDWDNSGGIDPVDVGVSIALDKDDDPKPTPIRPRRIIRAFHAACIPHVKYHACG